MGDENNIDDRPNAEKQYKKMERALRLVANVHISLDDYYAIMQLMNELPKETTLILYDI